MQTFLAKTVEVTLLHLCVTDHKSLTLNVKEEDLGFAKVPRGKKTTQNMFDRDFSNKMLSVGGKTMRFQIV